MCRPVLLFPFAEKLRCEVQSSGKPRHRLGRYIDTEHGQAFFALNGPDRKWYLPAQLSLEVPIHYTLWSSGNGSWWKKRSFSNAATDGTCSALMTNCDSGSILIVESKKMLILFKVIRLACGQNIISISIV